MPGIIVFNRRWSVGSDDLIVPAVILIVLHTVWIIVLAVVLNIVEFESDNSCGAMLRKHILGFLVILCVSVVIEMFGAWMSMRGTILNTEPRSGMHYVLYVRLGAFVVEIVWQVVGVVWIAQHFVTCSHLTAKHAILGVVVCNWIVMLCIVISIWCTFDAAGHSWVKLKRYQESMKGREVNSHQKRCSGNSRRNWRHRKAMRKYEQSWDRRCRILFCCIKDDKHRHSFAEVAKLFTEFFRDLDVVPSDIVAGLVLLRKHQQLHRKLIISQDSNDVYQFLSGVAVTPSTKFVNLQIEDVRSAYKKVVHYMRYALAAYGWPVYMMMNTGTGLCKIMPHLRCTCCCYLCCKPKKEQQKVVDDNCCHCNFAALCKLTGLNQLDLIYATYHVDIGETPFFIAVDHEERTIIISIRGTLSLQDVLTDLKADADMLPVEPVREDWLAHKGMVQAAVYIHKKIKEEMLLSDAFSRDVERGTQNYDLVVVGHSLGAGTAAILAILMKQEYPSLHCYAYAPPGGLLSMTCVEETKFFITSVIVGKDFVPRIGLHQLEALRQDLINVIKKSADPKWKIIMSSMLCCCKEKNDERPCTSTIEMSELMRQEKESRNFFHPADAQIALSTHTPLYLPGKILHIVRNHNRQSGCWACGREEPIYEAIWAENVDFDEVIISPVMANDHLPDKVLEALEKVLTSPTIPHDVPRCNSCDPASEGRDNDTAAGITSAAATAAEDQPSVLFFISSENQIVITPADDTRQKEITEPMLQDAILETHDTEDFPLTKPQLSLPVTHSYIPATASSAAPRLHEAVSLASPEAFSDACSLSMLDYVGSKRGAKSSPNPVEVRRSSSLPSAAPHAPLQKRCSSPSKRGELPCDESQSPTFYRNSADSNKSGGTAAVFEPKVSALLFHTEDDCEPRADPDSLTEFSVAVQNNSSTKFDLPNVDEGETAVYESHSPDRDSLGLQFLYDDYLGHYSAAGRGYPHGFNCCVEHAGFELPEISDVIRLSRDLSVNPKFKVSQQKDVSAFSKNLDYDNQPDLNTVNSERC